MNLALAVLVTTCIAFRDGGEDGGFALLYGRAGESSARGTQDAAGNSC